MLNAPTLTTAFRPDVLLTIADAAHRLTPAEAEAAGLILPRWLSATVDRGWLLVCDESSRARDDEGAWWLELANPAAGWLRQSQAEALTFRRAHPPCDQCGGALRVDVGDGLCSTCSAVAEVA